LSHYVVRNQAIHGSMNILLWSFLKLTSPRQPVENQRGRMHDVCSESASWVDRWDRTYSSEVDGLDLKPRYNLKSPSSPSTIKSVSLSVLSPQSWSPHHKSTFLFTSQHEVWHHRRLYSCCMHIFPRCSCCSCHGGAGKACSRAGFSSASCWDILPCSHQKGGPTYCQLSEGRSSQGLFTRTW